MNFICNGKEKRMHKYILIGLLISTPVYAQQPNQQIINQIEYNIKLTGPDLDLIGEGLNTQPFGKVVPLINKIKAQILEQQQAAQPKSPAAPEVPKEPEKK
jgi:hypothetical protein